MAQVRPSRFGRVFGQFYRAGSVWPSTFFAGSVVHYRITFVFNLRSIHFSANTFTFLYGNTLRFQDSLMILFNKIQNSPTTNITENVAIIKSMKIKLVQVATTRAVVLGFSTFISGLAMFENCIVWKCLQKNEEKCSVANSTKKKPNFKTAIVGNTEIL